MRKIAFLLFGVVLLSGRAVFAAATMDVSEIYLFLTKPIAIPKTPEGSPSENDVKLKYLISHHPLPEVRQDLFDAIYKTETLSYSYLDEEGLIAQFEEANVGGKFVPVLVVNPKMLAIRSKDQVYRALLVIYHEYLHYVQWRKSPPELKKDFREKRANEHLSAPLCRDIWKNEREAYFKECQVAVKWGKTYVISSDLCLKVGNEKAFDRDLLKSLSHGPNSKMISECEKTWRKTAL